MPLVNRAEGINCRSMYELHRHMDRCTVVRCALYQQTIMTRRRAVSSLSTCAYTDRLSHLNITCAACTCCPVLQGCQPIAELGQDYLLARLTDQSKAMELVNHRILASAACSHDDTYFALVEYKYKPKHTPDAFTNVGYKIMELDTMYDDTCLKVTSLSERSSFSPEDLAVMGQSDAGIKAMSSTTPFPEHEVTDYPTGLENEVVVNNLKTWCKARSSGESEVILDSALDHSFKLWDAYGMLPMLCDPARRAEPDACVVGFTDLKDMIKQTKHRYLVTCKMIDNGVSLDKNVAFTHWCSSITNKQSKQHFNIEGLEVDIFGSDGKLKNIWQFRDPMDFELDMLEGRMPAGDSYKAHAA
eukprot:GHRR01000687.1.p1 GENE.GHRR01000687.1~~GHRR01000687.1.p1  ORF type:complete len:358 (+),score=93.51 GHRR01000687.1:1338-2411(+)